MARLLLVSLLAACGTAPVDDGPTFASSESCAADWSDRFIESAEARGIDSQLRPMPDDAPYIGPNTGVIAEDLDGDRDIDLLFFDGREGLFLYDNDGSGDFTLREMPGAPDLGEGRLLRVVGAGDLDGDGLPELAWVGDGAVAVSTNLGGLTFSDFALVHYEEGRVFNGFASMAFGDIDSDGDLDLSVAGLDYVDLDERLGEHVLDATPSGDLLLFNDDGALSAPVDLICAGGPSLSMAHVFTDRDQDGDMDLMAWSDRSGSTTDFLPAVFWRNDGGTTPNHDLVDDARDVHADHPASAMGHASADLNGDQLPDYCVSDVSFSLVCLFSDGHGGYYEAGQAMGLTADPTQHPHYPGPQESMSDKWVPWGVGIVDLDNDGAMDAFATGAPIPNPHGTVPPPSQDFQPHWMWRGTPDGRFETSFDSGFLSSRKAWALATADLDGDGAREIITAPLQGRPEIWDNPSTCGHWLEVALEGPGNNVRGVGATVLVTAGGETQLMEVPSLTTSGQSPSELHFGLGDIGAVERIEVRWPGGARTVVEDVAADQHVVVRAD